MSVKIFGQEALVRTFGSTPEKCALEGSAPGQAGNGEGIHPVMVCVNCLEGNGRQCECVGNPCNCGSGQANTNCGKNSPYCG